MSVTYDQVGLTYDQPAYEYDGRKHWQRTWTESRTGSAVEPITTQLADRFEADVEVVAE